MAVETRDIAAESGDHVVQFYAHDDELVAAVGPYLAAATRADEVAIVIATEAHRRAFEAELEADGIDVAELNAGGSFFSLDAAGTMAGFMTGGQIDRAAFHEVIGGLVRTAAESGRAVRAYGEMVALLWDAGHVPVAIELETLWNDLGRQLPFSLFCSYPAASVAGSEHAQALHHVCHLHSSVLSPSAEGDQADVERTPRAEMTAGFPAEPESPGRARRLVTATLRQWRYGDVIVDDVALIVSELATNAVRHARSPFSIAVRMEDAMLHVAVHDGTPLSTTAPDWGSIPQSLHGLGLIDALSSDWGVEGASSGKVVWAELPCRAPIDNPI